MTLAEPWPPAGPSLRRLLALPDAAGPACRGLDPLFEVGHLGRVGARHQGCAVARSLNAT